MATQPTNQPNKKSKAREICRWVFDLTLVGAIIWYFSMPGKTEAFWWTLASWFNKGVSIAFPLYHDQIRPLTTASSKKVPEPPVFTPPPLPTKEQLAKEVGGDCYPPEAHGQEDARAAEKLFYAPPAIPKVKKPRKTHGTPIKLAKKKLKGVPFYQLSIDLNDPETYMVIRLPHNATQANSTTFTAGHELFDSYVKRLQAAAIVNGTFFSKDDQERVMGNMVSEGKMLKYSQWENYGTTLSLGQGNYPEMVTARAEGQPQWSGRWFSVTCGPRLVKQGEVWLNPELEGFADSHVLGVGPRSAIGFTKSRDQLYIMVFLRGLSLKEEAELTKAIGCYEAMNIDGGASKALADEGSVVIPAGRGLTNVIAVYDAKHKAPENVVEAWQEFQHVNDP